MLKKSKILIYFLLGLIFGFFLTIFIKKFSSFTIDSNIGLEINPFEFLVLVINVILAIYITRTLGKKIDSEKNEKQYLIDYLQEFRREFSNSVQCLLDDDDFDSERSKTKLKYLRQKNNLILNILKNNKFIVDDDGDAMHLKPIISQIWHQLTNEEEDFILRKREINSNLNKVDEIFFHLIFKINKK